MSFKPRDRAFPLPTAPMKIYEAPEVLGDPHLNIIDWGPQNNPFVIRSKLAVGLFDQVYLIDHLTGTNSVIANLNSKKTTGSKDSYICSINFDRSGEALAIGTSDRQVQIYDVERQQKVRQITGSGARVSSLSWNRSIMAPYLITASGADSIIMNHDVRVKNSMVSLMRKHLNEVITLNWSANSSYE